MVAERMCRQLHCLVSRVTPDAYCWWWVTTNNSVSKYKGYAANSSHSCHSHISYILTSRSLLHLDCVLIVSGEQKILLFFACCSQTTRLRGCCWAEVFWNIYLFFKWNIFFEKKKCALFYCISWKHLAYCMSTGHLVLFIKYMFRIYWLPAKAVWGIARWFSSGCHWFRNPRGKCENKENPHTPRLYLDRILRQ